MGLVLSRGTSPANTELQNLLKGQKWTCQQRKQKWTNPAREAITEGDDNPHQGLVLSRIGEEKAQKTYVP